MSWGEHTLRAAKDERELESMLKAIEDADLEECMRFPWGRRMLGRIIFNVAGLEARSFDPGIKDGVCHSQHMARAEGMREVAIVLARSIAAKCPDLWAQLNIERWSVAAEEARLRDAVRNASTDGER